MKTKLIIFAVLFFVFFLACEKVNNPEYNVDSSACNACGDCLDVCPKDALEFGPDGKAIIDQTKCNQCGNCLTICPQNAIY